MTEETMAIEQEGLGPVAAATPDPQPPQANGHLPDDARFSVDEGEPAQPATTGPRTTGENPPPWASVESVSDLLGLDELRVVLEQRDTQTRAAIEAEYRRRNHSAETEQLMNRLSSEFGRVVQQLESGDLEGTEKVLSRLEPMVDKVTGQARDDAMLLGIQAQGMATTNVLLARLPAGDERQQLDEFFAKGDVTIGGAIDEFHRIKMKPLLQRKDQEIARLNDVIERIKAEGRTGQGPNLAQSAPGGGNSINSMDDADREYAAGRMPHEDYKDARARFGIK